MSVFFSVKNWLAVILFISSTVSQASVLWSPDAINQDVNFVTDDSSYVFGIFDDSVNIGSLAKDVNLALFAFAGDETVQFESVSGGYKIKSDSSESSGILSGSNIFQIGLFDRLAGWESVQGIDGEDNMFVATFPGDVSLWLVDVNHIMSSAGIVAVPLPASIWMMTSALFALLFSSRRRSMSIA